MTCSISRIEAGQLRVVRETCSASSAPLRSGGIVPGRAEAETFDPRDPDLAARSREAIATDRLRIQQVLVNLLDNAIKFTERGTIRLTARMTGYCRLRT